MARTANVFARVEPEVKEQAEQVLDRLGIPMSNAVGMFLRQIVLQRGIPFEMKLPAYEEPVACFLSGQLSPGITGSGLTSACAMSTVLLSPSRTRRAYTTVR